MKSSNLSKKNHLINSAQLNEHFIVSQFVINKVEEKDISCTATQSTNSPHDRLPPHSYDIEDIRQETTQSTPATSLPITPNNPLSQVFQLYHRLLKEKKFRPKPYAIDINKLLNTPESIESKSSEHEQSAAQATPSRPSSRQVLYNDPSEPLELTPSTHSNPLDNKKDESFHQIPSHSHHSSYQGHHNLQHPYPKEKQDLENFYQVNLCSLPEILGNLTESFKATQLLTKLLTKDLLAHIHKNIQEYTKDSEELNKETHPTKSQINAIHGYLKACGLKFAYDTPGFSDQELAYLAHAIEILKKQKKELASLKIFEAFQDLYKNYPKLWLSTHYKLLLPLKQKAKIQSSLYTKLKNKIKNHRPRQASKDYFIASLFSIDELSGDACQFMIASHCIEEDYLKIRYDFTQAEDQLQTQQYIKWEKYEKGLIINNLLSIFQDIKQTKSHLQNESNITVEKIQAILTAKANEAETLYQSYVIIETALGSLIKKRKALKKDGIHVYADDKKILNQKDIWQEPAVKSKFLEILGAFANDKNNEAIEASRWMLLLEQAIYCGFPADYFTSLLDSKEANKYISSLQESKEKPNKMTWSIWLLNCYYQRQTYPNAFEVEAKIALSQQGYKNFILLYDNLSKKGLKKDKKIQSIHQKEKLNPFFKTCKTSLIKAQYFCSWAKKYFKKETKPLREGFDIYRNLPPDRLDEVDFRKKLEVTHYFDYKGSDLQKAYQNYDLLGASEREDKVPLINIPALDHMKTLEDHIRTQIMKKASLNEQKAQKEKQKRMESDKKRIKAEKEAAYFKALFYQKNKHNAKLPLRQKQQPPHFNPTPSDNTLDASLLNTPLIRPQPKKLQRHHQDHPSYQLPKQIKPPSNTQATF